MMAINGPYGDVPLDRVWRVFPNYKHDEICLYSKYTRIFSFVLNRVIKLRHPELRILS